MLFSIVRRPIGSILVLFGGRDLKKCSAVPEMSILSYNQPYFCCRYFLIVWNNLANLYLWRQCFAALGSPTRHQFLWQTSNIDFMFLSSNRESRLFCQTFAFDRNACNRSIPLEDPGGERTNVHRSYFWEQSENMYKDLFFGCVS